MKRTVLALCIGLMIGLSSHAFAAVGDKVEAVFAEFVFVVDGVEKKLDAQPVVINGSSYLPVRTVANLVGKDVIYKADTKTIELNTPTELAIESEAITEMDYESIIKAISDAQIDKDMYQKKIDDIINELKAKYKLSDQEIENDKMTMQVINAYRQSIVNIDKNIDDLEAQKAVLEAQ